MKGGVATFKNLTDDTAETIALGFSGAGLTAGPSSYYRHQPGAGQPTGDPHPAVGDGNGRSAVLPWHR